MCFFADARSTPAWVEDTVHPPIEAFAWVLANSVPLAELGRVLLRILFLTLTLVVVVRGMAQQVYHHAVLDTLVPALAHNNRDVNLSRIDRALKAAGTQADPRLLYHLRRYRCEQLYYQGLLDESMVEAETARRIAEDLKDSVLIASSLNQVAVLLEERREDEQGIALLSEALHWYPRTIRYPYPLAKPHRIHGNLGLCWANLGDLDSARHHQQRSLALAQQAMVPRGEALALLELGRIERARARPDSALRMFDRSIAVAASNGIHDVLLDAWSAKAQAFIEAGRGEEMLAALEHGRAIIQAHTDIAPRSVLAFMEMEMRSLAKAGRYHEALEAGRSWRAKAQALRTADARTAQRILQELHETNAELEEEQERATFTANERAAEDRIRTVLLIGGAVILGLLTALVLNLMARDRQRARLARLAVLQLEQERQIADLRVRQQVAEDLHDDLGAGLSALKLNSELAADLCADPTEQHRVRSLAAIAGGLIASMRHILWSLTQEDLRLADLITYIKDRARAYCDEHGHIIAIGDPGAWPELPVEAETRHLAWPVVRDALDALLVSGPASQLGLDLDWKEGITLIVRSTGNTDSAVRRNIADRMSAHHLKVSRAGGWLRSSTDGAPAVKIHLPIAATALASERNSVKRMTGVALTIICLALSSSVAGQRASTYRHPLLDRHLSEQAMAVPSEDRIQAINAAIMEADTLREPMVMYHLLMARAKRMYYDGLFDVGMVDADRALELAHTLNDSLLIATAFNMVGLLNENLGDAAITLPWFCKAAAWLPDNSECAYPVVKDYHLQANMAQCLLDLQQGDSAIHHFQHSLQSAQKSGDLRASALANLGLARALLDKGDPTSISALLDSTQGQALRCGSTDVFVDALPVRARHLLHVRRPTEAIKVLDDAQLLVVADSTINRSSVRRFYEQAGPIRVALGQYKEAYAAWLEWQILDSAIRTMDEKATLATLRIMLDNGEQLARERVTRERAQSQLAIDRSVRGTILSTASITALLMLGLILLLFNRQRYKRNLETLELERLHGQQELAQLRIRQRISEDMLADLGTGLEALRLRSQLSSQWQHAAADRERMARIAMQATELGTDLKQIVWAMDSGRSSLAETVRFTAHYAATYCTQQGLTLHLHTSDELPGIVLSMQQRRNIFLVVKEALHNVVKHARATEVSLAMACNAVLAVTIADNGRGPSAASTPREGNGLRNMRKRIEAIDGTFSTSDQNGMVIRFTVPLTDNNGSELRTIT